MKTKKQKRIKAWAVIGKEDLSLEGILLADMPYQKDYYSHAIFEKRNLARKWLKNNSNPSEEKIVSCEIIINPKRK